MSKVIFTQEALRERRRKPWKKTWNNHAIDAIIARLKPELFWDYNDGFSKEQILQVVNEGEDALDEIRFELQGLNLDQIDELKASAIEEGLADMRRRGVVSEATERRYRQRAEERVFVNENLDDLMRSCTGLYFTVCVTPEIYYQAWYGVADQEEVDNICRWCEILNVNPAHLQPLMRDGVDLAFPTIPERDGQEYVSIQELLGVFRETTGGGEMVFLCTLDLKDLVNDLDGYREGPLRIRKGALMTINNYGTGNTSCGDAPLLKDLVLPKGGYRLRYDAALSYGVQSVCDMTPKPWKCGVIEPA